jgi:outer membrane lipoprotein-sorting protein
MKSILSLLAAVAVSFSALAQTADEVIDNHFDAIGGKDNWRKVTSMKMEATVSTQGMDIPITVYQVHNKAMKQEINVMNMVGYVIMTTEGGWNFLPFMGQTVPEPMTTDDLEVGKEQLDIQGELLDYKAKGHSVELLGKEDVDGTDCHKLKLTRKSGRSTTYLIDAKTNYVVRTIIKVKANGQEVDQTQNFSNYQKQPFGIVVPLSMENSGLPAPLVVSKVEVNPTIEASVFEVKK